MFIKSDVGSTHQQHNLSKNHSTATTSAMMATKVNRDSHRIKKPSTTSPPLTPTNRTHHRQPQPPVIIYAHAPKVIHTKPQEFKALVQTLTGFTGNKNTTTAAATPTKNDLQSPPAKPPTQLLPPSTKVPMYYDFEEFETKNVVPLTNNSLKTMMEENLNMSFLNGDGGYNFMAPIFDPPLMHQANSTSLPCFTPAYEDQFCCTNNNFNTANSSNNSVGFVGKMSSGSNNNQMFYSQNYVAAESGSGSDCYYSDGLSSSLDLSSSLSSVEEAIDELADFF